ncbi:MAG: pyridoxal phosphate-dependent aminotransferase [Desulfobacula sp.]|jgi:aspartate/methionine/tyrosine aminotransferase|uniref:pyridoxal phosphate-dependent aminotransferase n=1 Tax=Desulfobacula sp. TaxID=2593537 RepID=UPI001D1DC9C3|nr:pyridoxal phosphate-dependent aminotransferase [Desulfobacula sp.]MBT3485020.1 pyridoxal phosphate-dependent aminotransferase [Desulfobacula sp.]MBT3804163.1 pyridoxal phosphate-dependent aminotransferase [Desulfobacula sp.]MBT4025019.1 pyridoxal phosphate-dependent aminotransferase [Desulfobacula sp.]MBT4198671.1 pyridoxal phosphate-dependent aminotransferase [Desulfobacula sp.]
MKPAKRCEKITPFIVMEIMEKIHKMEASGIDVIHMEIGEPDFNVPECVNEVSIEAFLGNETHYTHSLGDIRLREAISQYHKITYDTTIDPGHILVTSGTSPAMLLLFSVLVNPGDEIIISDPHYACYANFINYVQGIPVTVPVFEEEGFVYTPEAIKEKITPKTRGIFINSPSNPTGNVIPKERMQQIVDIADANNIYIISDEIYHGLVYEGHEHSIYEFTDKAFVLNGFSKLFAMTGLRLGYLIAPPEFVRALQILQQNFFICANSVAQLSGVAALKDAHKETQEMRETYNKRRIYVIDRLKKMGLGITIDPTGAFYVFANAKHISHDSYALAFDILEKAHVGVTPGIDFGENGEGYLRFSYANSMENLKTGLDRLEGYLRELP